MRLIGQHRKPIKYRRSCYFEGVELDCDSNDAEGAAKGAIKDSAADNQTEGLTRASVDALEAGVWSEGETVEQTNTSPSTPLARGYDESRLDDVEIFTEQFEHELEEIEEKYQRVKASFPAGSLQLSLL